MLAKSFALATLAAMSQAAAISADCLKKSELYGTAVSEGEGFAFDQSQDIIDNLPSDYTPLGYEICVEIVDKQPMLRSAQVTWGAVLVSEDEEASDDSAPAEGEDATTTDEAADAGESEEAADAGEGEEAAPAEDEEATAPDEEEEESIIDATAVTLSRIGQEKTETSIC